MNNHPTHDLMSETMQKIRELIDVNTIIGKPIETPDNVTIIPVSKVAYGFGTGGSDFQAKKAGPNDNGILFGGGGGAGITISPVAFLIIADGNVRLLPMSTPPNTSLDRVIELLPDVMDRINKFLHKDTVD